MSDNWLFRRRFDVDCVVQVSHRFESLGAHVSLPPSVDVAPGDRVRVHGAPIHVAFGEVVREERRATVIRAPRWERAWIRTIGNREALELLDVSFSDAHQAPEIRR